MATLDNRTNPADDDTTTPATQDALTARLDTGLTQVQDELRRADTKATALLGLFGGALAGALALTRTEPSPAAAVLLYLAAAPIATAVVQLLLALRPRIGVTTGFTRWALMVNDPTALLTDLSLPTRNATRVAALRLTDLSALAVTKYRLIRRAVHLLLAGLALLALAVLTA